MKGGGKMAYVWLGLMIILGITEAVTMQLVSIWLAGGALCASIAAMCGLNELWQVAIFLAVSAILLITTRPLVKKLTKNGKEEKTNSDRIIGEKVILTEEVNNLLQTGKAVINGVEWTVRSSSGSIIEEGKIVTVEKIEGVKLIVSE